MSTMGDKHPLYFPFPPIMAFSENLRSSHSVVSRSLPRIVSYLPLVDSSTWHVYVTISVALNYGKQKTMLPFFEAVNFPAWVSHIVLLLIMIQDLMSAYP